MNEERPSPETLRAFIQTEWADLHHSRLQEWTALGVVAGVHLALMQLVSFLADERAAIDSRVLVFLACAIAAAFAVFGILITWRHRHLMKVKLHWIYQAEDRLGLIGDSEHPGIIPRADAPTRSYPWRGLAAPRPLSTGGLVTGFYLLLIAVDVLVALAFPGS
ncbi:MAG TPA: hypothetical protein VFR37_09065 [Longimicrobium sp.]|nr:hypothetical protein [Longimicrobium sp.]